MDSISHGNTSVRLWTRSGKVVDTSKHTSVVSSGSGENLSVSSITKQDIWIREENGTEVPIQIAGVDIPLRVGQRVSVIGAALDGEEDGYAVALVNHSSGQWSRALSEESVRSRFRVTTHWAVGWVILAVSFIFFGIWSSTTPETSTVHSLAVASPLGGIAYLVYNLRLYFKSGERLYRCFGDVADNLAQEEYDTVVGGKAQPVKDGLESSDMTVLSRKALFGSMILALPIAFAATISGVGDISEIRTEAGVLLFSFFLLFFPPVWALLSILGGIRKWILPKRRVIGKTQDLAVGSSGQAGSSNQSAGQTWTWWPVTICTFVGLLTVPLITLIIEVDPVQMLAPGEWQEALMAVGAFTTAGGVVGLIISGGIWTWRFLRKS